VFPNTSLRPAPDVSPRVAVPVTGAAGAGAFSGTLQLLRLAADDGDLTAVGLVTGVLTTTTGVVSMARTVRLPALLSGASSRLLQLDLGALTLDILWWRIDFGRIVVEIATEPGDVSLELLLREIRTLRSEPTRLARLLNGILDLQR
jgi:hypothetical protein